MSTALVNVKGVMDNVIRALNDKAEMVHRDLVERWNSTTSTTSRQPRARQAGQRFWHNFHHERTAMLVSKENYYNHMYTLHQTSPLPGGPCGCLRA